MSVDTVTTPADTATRPFSTFEWMLSLRYLRARRREGFISVIAGFSFLGIMLGVATLIVVMSVMNGFRKELVGKILGINGHIFVQAYDQPFTDWAEVTDRIIKVPGVAHALPLVEGQALASTPTNRVGVLVRGVREADLKKIKAVAGNIRSGTLDQFDSESAIAVGTRMSNSLNAFVGDKITLLNPQGVQTPMGVQPNIKAYPVNTVFEIGMSEFDATFVFMPLSDAQAFFDKPDIVTVIEVYADDADRIDGVKAAIEKSVGRPVLMSDWRQRNGAFISALKVERNVMFVILMLIVLVAALNIVSGLIMLVKDKSRDIAILRTMGATKGAILRIFFITGAAIGVVGTLAGVVLGIVFAWNVQRLQELLSWLTGNDIWDPTVRFLTSVPVDINPAEVVSIVLLTLVLSFLATLYPAWRAAKLDPVEALRYE